MIALSIIMPSLLRRLESSEIYAQLQSQIGDSNEVEFICLMDNGPLSTGRKMGELLRLARGDYIAMVGDDDRVADDYLAQLLAAIKEHHGIDVITFDHSYHVDGTHIAQVEQVPRCVEQQYKKETEYEIHTRLPGPLCPVRAELAKQFMSPDISEREDKDYKLFIRNHAETYHNIDRCLYHHLWNSANKRERSSLQWRWRRR